MTLLSTTMNHAANLTLSESFFARNVAARLLNTVICPPLETLLFLKNIVKLPLQTVSMAVKIPATLINLAVNSKTLREFESELSGPLDIIKTALKIAGYAIGTFTTILLGTISPMTNFRLHYALNLVKDEKVEAQIAAKNLEAKKKKEAYERMLEEQLRKVTEALKLKIMESLPPPVESTQETETAPFEAPELPLNKNTEIIPFVAEETEENPSAEEINPLSQQEQIEQAE